jgi:hypothetical protein
MALSSCDVTPKSSALVGIICRFHAFRIDSANASGQLVTVTGLLREVTLVSAHALIHMAAGKAVAAEASDAIESHRFNAN